MINQINPAAKIVEDEQRLRPSKSEVFRLYGDNSKILKYTNWTVEHNLSQGLAKCVEWYSNKENLKHFKAQVYNV